MNMTPNDRVAGIAPFGIAKPQADRGPRQAVSLRGIWGPATVALGLGFTVAWIIFVGYSLLTLMGFAV